MNITLLMLGGAAGSILRYLLGKAVMSAVPNPPFPTAMLVVNILGALGLGLFIGFNYSSVPFDIYSDTLYLTIGLGFFGAFTTFSTFSVEAFQLLEKRRLGACFAYITLSFAGSLLLFAVGFFLVS
ncbi:fluoride efflux transporter CrcB [Salsuginibacillus kocurii]|uniref:fluoride efflux transporter CrcB n=1 Tax=Salsuginibacillus kocurii TaxID=427078 RepID=UPI00036A85F5|nr:fluoride efflux transporter CrcB [Salsuginibacillus kocurii]